MAEYGDRVRRVRRVWRRTLSLSWPIAVQQTLNTLMRTVDIIVTGLFSPTAVAAVGLADLYAQLPLRIGLGLETGAITLSSQDMFVGATPIARLFTSDPATLEYASTFARVFGVSMFFFGLFFRCRGASAARAIRALPSTLDSPGPPASCSAFPLSLASPSSTGSSASTPGSSSATRGGRSSWRSGFTGAIGRTERRR